MNKLPLRIGAKPYISMARKKAKFDDYIWIVFFNIIAFAAGICVGQLLK